MGENLPPGFRFHPTDEELITYYLSNKVFCFNFTTKAMADVDLNKCEPWDLPAKASMGEKEWYFFSLKDRKYPTGMRTNRATEAGYWKTTGKDKEIFQGRVLVGMKKTLVFYKGRAPKGEKTNWVMHEYRLESKLAFKSSQEEWVVCRVFQKSVTAKRPSYQTPQSPQSMESPCDNITSINANDFGDNIELLPNLNTIADSSFSQTEAYNNSTTDALNVVNWNAIRDVANALPSITWPSSFLNTSLGINPFLLRALQLRNLEPRSEATDYSMISNGVQSNLGTDHLISSNFMASEVLDSVDQQQHQQQEQPYDLDSNIW